MENWDNRKKFTVPMDFLITAGIVTQSGALKNVEHIVSNFLSENYFTKVRLLWVLVYGNMNFYSTFSRKILAFVNIWIY